jgi:glycosyltransferase involved in cell wall biosynthesis
MALKAGGDSLSVSETLYRFPDRIPTDRVPLVGLTRVRNEELLLVDTLAHLSLFVDRIVAFDDASTDSTLEILSSHPKVAAVVSNSSWEPGIEDRLRAETSHRNRLLSISRSLLDFDWCLYADADERFFGDIRGFVTAPDSRAVNGVRIQLFDAYMTSTDHAAYDGSIPLLNFRKFFGPERRDILMMWRDDPEVAFVGLDAREPRVPGPIGTRFFCQHFGKSLSVEHWEETCDYYRNHFPYDSYGRKWEARKGKAIHTLSDFGRPLYTWGPSLFENAVALT